MIWIVVSWFFQDFLQVFLSQSIPVPEYFLLVLLFRVLLQEANDKSSFWIAFAGGLLWDLRWTGLLGLSAGLYVSVVMLLSWLWHLLPVTGRTVWVFCSLLWLGPLIISVARSLIWDMNGSFFISGFLVQQLCIIPVIILMGAYFNWKVSQYNG